jgi:hypothetical protein
MHLDFDLLFDLKFLLAYQFFHFLGIAPQINFNNQIPNKIQIYLRAQ